MQRVLGYSLTGITREHAMFFAYGKGRNGKSVLIDTIVGIMGNYAASAAMDTFTASTFDKHPTDLADLATARFVTSVETDEGRAWAEARIKTLTGGDRVKARFMRADFFEYTPQFKLFIAGNHQPTLRTVDEAMRGRFNLIPFTQTIPAEERDKMLTQKLKAEWPAILRWLIDGCLAWQRDGLNPPAAVKSATSTYFDNQDAIAAWIEECCETAPGYQDRASRLFASWKTYADRMGEVAGSSKTFGPTLENRGFQKRHTKAGNVYFGLRIKEVDDVR
jgi:putative DNA primase/helicase